MLPLQNRAERILLNPSMSVAELSPGARRGLAVAIGLAALLLVMLAELAFSARQQSQTFDEAAHIFSGYRYWKNFDFGMNPEHPPLVKLIAALPLLHMPIHQPQLPAGDFKAIEFAFGREFLYSNDAGAILFRARLAAAVFTVALALSIFLFARRLFGIGPAFVALIIFVFEPNFLAHGALVTTDVAVAFGLFLGVATFHWYCDHPTVVRLLAVGLAAGICMTVKHSGLLLFPMLLLQSLLGLPRITKSENNALNPEFASAIGRRTLSILAVAAIAFVFLWSTYGFRYSARPSNLGTSPSLPAFAQTMRPAGSTSVLTLARFHLLPESYLYGAADVFSPKSHPTSIFGKYYPSARWFYFPSLFLIKSTAAFLISALLAGLSATIRPRPRHRLVLLVPAAVYFVTAMFSGMNFGIRHLLPIYPFLIVFISTAAWSFANRHRLAAMLVALLLLFHVASSLRAFPNYIPYANEFWGGSANSYRILADSNVDWGQGLIALKQYTDEHPAENCWFAYFGALVSDPSYYGIPCKPLPTSFSSLVHRPTQVIPPVVDGPVFLSASEVSSIYWRAEWANLYRPIQQLKPSALVANSILAFDGKVDLSLVAAFTHENAAMQYLEAGLKSRALAEADIAVSLAPNRPVSHAARASVLAALDRRAEADQELSRARELARIAQTADR